MVAVYWSAQINKSISRVDRITGGEGSIKVYLEIDGGCSRSFILDAAWPCLSTQPGPWAGSMLPPSSAIQDCRALPFQWCMQLLAFRAEAS